MPVSTRSKTRAGQPPARVTSPRVNRPRRPANSRQGNAVVAGVADSGSQSTSIPVANGSRQAAGFYIDRCKHPLCRTCPFLVLSKEFSSSVTKKNYTMTNLSAEKIHCHLQNCIYLLTCLRCNIQYVGETARQINERMNIHRTAKQVVNFLLNI